MFEVFVVCVCILGGEWFLWFGEVEVLIDEGVLIIDVMCNVVCCG